MKQKFSVLDINIGNVGSVVNMCSQIGVEMDVVKSQNEIYDSDFLIIPGVGSFDFAMNRINDLNILDSLNYVALKKKIPVLGICLGMQIMTKSSAEGTCTGLAWLDADVCHFNLADKLRVPHMGWNTIVSCTNNYFLPDTVNSWSFYFVHSYFVKCNDKSDVLMKTYYGKPFVSAFKKSNLFGVQFHPEKSHIYGKNLLKNIFTYYKTI